LTIKIHLKVAYLTVDSSSGHFLGISTIARYLAIGDWNEANTNEGSTVMALVSSKGEFR